MPSAEKLAKKTIYFDKLVSLLKAYPKLLVVHADYVRSSQLQTIRQALRGKAIVLMGKNTMIRHVLREYVQEFPQLEKLMPHVYGNIGFVFCIVDPTEVRDIIKIHTVPAPAKQGVIAPSSVTLPAGPTGLDPSQTSFFQALGISTKIVKGQIEIQSEVPIIKEGFKVNASESVLLKKLNICPFSYGLNVQKVYDDGSIYQASVLDMGDDVILEKFVLGIKNVAAMSRGLGIPTAASVPHSVVDAFKLCAALTIDSDYTFPQVESLKAYLKDPSAFASAVVAAPSVAAPAAKVAAAPVKEEEEEDEDMGFGLFD